MCMKWKGDDKFFIRWIDKTEIYFSRPYSHSKNKVNAELDLSNYVTKSDVKKPAGVDLSKFAEIADLASTFV